MPQTFYCKRCRAAILFSREATDQTLACARCGTVYSHDETNVPLTTPILDIPTQEEEQPPAAELPLIDTTIGNFPHNSHGSTTDDANPFQSPMTGHEDWQDEEIEPRDKYIYRKAIGDCKGPAQPMLVLACINLIPLLLIVFAWWYEILWHSGTTHTGPDSTIFYVLNSAAVANLIVVFGSLSMMRLKNYSLAMTACVLAMVPTISACCILNIPFGVWGIITLMSSKTRQGFQIAREKDLRKNRKGAVSDD